MRARCFSLRCAATGIAAVPHTSHRRCRLSVVCLHCLLCCLHLFVAVAVLLQRSKLEAHPMFDPVSEEELAADPAAQLLDQASEEAQKVSRNSGATYRAVFRRRESPRDS
jgi:hypothetical protein